MNPISSCRTAGIAGTIASAVAVLLLDLSAAERRDDRQAPQQFRASVEIVEVTVTVTDEQGQPVVGLREADFTILEENRPQTITVFGEVSVPRPPPRQGRPDVGSPSVASNDFAPDGRVFALVLDDQLTQPFRTQSVRKLAREFVEQHVGPSDLVGVFSTGGRGVLTQEFTTDHGRVLQAIDRFQGNRIRYAETHPERVHDIRNAMDALAEVASHLASVRGRRLAVLLFSEGIDYDIYRAVKASAIPGYLSPTEMTAFLGGRSGGAGGGSGDPDPTAVVLAVQQALAALSQGNVVLYGVDPRGLYSPDGEWIEYNARDASAVPPTREEHARSIDSLRTISERTGGLALVNTNDFGPGFRRIVDESSHYYVLGYSPSNPGQPGEFRKIAVRVGSGLRVSSRLGYVVPPRGAPIPSAPAVLTALDDSLPQPHLPLRVQAIPLPPRTDGSRVRPVQIVVEIDGGGLAFREENGRFSEQVQVAVKTVDDLARDGHRHAEEIKLPPLSPAQRERIVRGGLRWMTTIEAQPGHYNLRVAAHAVTAGRSGSVFTDLVVPPLDSTPSVFLSEILVTAPSAADASTAGARSALPLPGPPTTRRTFQAGEAITFAAVVEGRTTPVVTATLTPLDSGSTTPSITGALPVTSTETGMHVVFSLPPEARQPGRFVLRLTARSPGGETQERATVLEIVGSESSDAPPASGNRPSPAP